MNILTSIAGFDIPPVALVLLAIIFGAASILMIVDFVVTIIYFFKGNKSKLLSQDIADVVMKNNGLTNAEVTGGWIAIRYWNYSRKTKKLKLRKPFQYNRKNVNGMITSSCEAYNAVLIENRDPRRWAVRMLGAFAPFVFVMGIVIAVVFFTAMGGNEILAWTGAAAILLAFTFFGMIMTIYGLVVLRRGVVKGFEDGVKNGQFHQKDLDTVRFWFKLKIAVAVATLIINTIELIAKIANEVNKKNND